MNQMTKEFHGNATLAKKQALVALDGGCEHAEADASTVAYVHYEKDSFGPVSSYACCEACSKKADDEENSETYVCVDCKETKPQRDGIQWKWYDFYAAQGDVPLFVCDCCRPKEAHQARVARDQRDYDEEFGVEDNNSDNDCDCDACWNRN